MPTYISDDLPKEVKELVELAQSRKITPIHFCKAIEEQGITGAEKILYVAEAFGISLEKSKEIWIEADYGSFDEWEEEMDCIIDALPPK